MARYINRLNHNLHILFKMALKNIKLLINLCCLLIISSDTYAQKIFSKYRVIDLSLDSLHPSSDDKFGILHTQKGTYSSEYLDKTVFGGNTFLKYVGFYMTAFQDTLIFSQNESCENAEFGGLKCFKYAQFEMNEFQGDTKFYSCDFMSKISFDHSTFPKSLTIETTFFKESPSLRIPDLPKKMGLSSIKFGDQDCVLDFRSAELGSNPGNSDKCQVTISNVDVTKLILPSHLFTVDFWFLRNRELMEYERSKYEDEITGVYEPIIKTCKDLGMMKSAEEWDIEYKTQMNKFKKLGALYTFFQKHWWNFGYNKERILWIWLPSMYLLFCFINFFLINWIVSDVYRDEELGKSFGLQYKKTGKFFERLSYTLFLTAVIYFNFKLKFDSVNYKNIVGLLFVYTIYSIGTIHVAFGVLGYIFKI
jgi:hypothetical protein